VTLPCFIIFLLFLFRVCHCECPRLDLQKPPTFQVLPISHTKKNTRTSLSGPSTFLGLLRRMTREIPPQILDCRAQMQDTKHKAWQRHLSSSGIDSHRLIVDYQKKGKNNWLKTALCAVSHEKRRAIAHHTALPALDGSFLVRGLHALRVANCPFTRAF
jgi:aminoglycoside phosphotransferase